MEQAVRQTQRYSARFAELREKGQKGFIPFTLLGWPDWDTSLEIVQTMVAGGASALELGLPFSDPMADGPIIQQAATEALAHGFRVDDGLALIHEVRTQNSDIPIGLLVYYNMVLARGIERFFRDIANAGVDGVLIADLPPEVADEVADAARQFGVDLIFIVSPLTTAERLERILTHAGGFLYVVSRLGITGTEARYDDALSHLLNRLNEQTDLPKCVGFGISTPEQAQRMFALGADGVITGSRIIQLIEEHRRSDIGSALRSFMRDMVKTTL